MRLADAYDGAEGVTKLAMLVWDTNTLAWVRYTPTAGAGGGGDASAANQTTEITKLEAIRAAVTGTLAVSTGQAQALTDAQLRAVPVPVSGAFFPATQPVSAAALPLPAGAATEATLLAVAKDGTDINAPSAMPAGGVGIRGWLSAIWTKLNGSLAVTGAFFQATQPVSIAAAVAVTGPLTDLQLRAAVVPVSMATQTPDVTDRAARLLGVVASIAGALPAGSNVIGAVAPATLVVTAVSAANTAVTATLVAAGAGLFHYISRIVVERVATAAIAGTAVLTYTSTNLNAWARTTGNAAPVGQQMKDVDEQLGAELRSQVANTNTTIVAPAAGATGIIRITVYYRTAT